MIKAATHNPGAGCCAKPAERTPSSSASGHDNKCCDSRATSEPKDEKFSAELDRWKEVKTSFINREGEWETPGGINREGEWEPAVHINRDGEWTSDRDWGTYRD